jgi:hypothetical protein
MDIPHMRAGSGFLAFFAYQAARSFRRGLKARRRAGNIIRSMIGRVLGPGKMAAVFLRYLFPFLPLALTFCS